MVEGTYEQLLLRIAKNIKRIRKVRQLTQEEVADKADFNYRYFQKVESGRQSYNLNTLYRVAKVLKTEVKNFFD